MESGQNKLLTIAIPTWNRAEKLKEALNHLLPQIIEFKNEIEFIISDNASTDHTSQVVFKIKDIYPDFNFVFYRHSQNTGFYGNFTKCIELGTSKYFWLLSDDDFVLSGVVSQIISILRSNDVGAIFLNDWSRSAERSTDLIVEFINKHDFFSNQPYRHSLISSVIYLNTVTRGDVIFDDLKENALIGYAVFLKAVHDSDIFAVIKNYSLCYHNDSEVRFDALKIFTNDLAKCIQLADQYFDRKIVTKIADSFVKTNILSHLNTYKIQRKYNNENSSYFKMFKFFLRFKSFWIVLFPRIIIPRFLYKIIKN